VLTRPTKRIPAVLLTITLLAAGAAVLRAGSVHATTGNLDLRGHGWGHGRGLGQYGALGYAVNSGWTGAQILNHYYSNTTAGTVDPNSIVTVRITERDAKSTIVTQEKGHLFTSADPTPTARQALRVDRVGSNTFQVYDGPGCAGPWTARAGTIAGPVRIYPQVVNDDRTEMLQLCQATGTRWYRGDMRATEDTTGSQRTVNVVGLDSYVRGVVPRESPASWGDLGGGKGMQALIAQAVAARSYAWAGNKYPPYAKTCDTTTCQVYGGRAVQTSSGFTNLEDPRSDSAVAQTAGGIRLLNGAPASTEFSSSTGGYTAGGVFPAVIDEGDAISSNPNHTWTTSIPLATIESYYGKGSFSSANVTSRNGLGEDGGRVLNIRLNFSGGSVDASGAAFASAFGLKSSWFTPLNGRPNGPPGYHILNRGGGIYSFGDARYFGNLIDHGYPGPAVGLADTPDGNGYAVLTSFGGIYTFGNAHYFGNLIDHNYPGTATAISMTPSGAGYAILTAGGGLYTFGDARYFGNLIDHQYPGRAVSFSYTASGNGYSILTDSGALYTFGDAVYRGNLLDHGYPGPAVSLAHTRAGDGYYILTQAGALYSFGTAPYFGNLLDNGFPGPAAAISTTP
jgi:SpoIID/LytB domain protein